ncbi:hypothetical protein LZ757_09860 [Xylella fastidiosa subsp. morus]|uniref:DUF805 domain-containing protein n=1 Tax=Xylella fastidiosa subsp. multiplex TaxID=644357 RepID=A0AAW6HVW8_XYLFS|nr:hypothetical protein [Xylella fastidiosa]ERI60928.1 hypothetical protein M233_01895 [Xylella fastidiosa subsp. multiplex Griffin-1]ACA11452.1 conserved hypothetical protein [Xylella fastidiosa M12]AIC13526.1 hypothetical protein P303_01415 [Xylella fastidiosa MUL0034]KAJ4852386.1 hypothetical protein XYFPCFBP8418_011055 [Xylella fastidiosa subsp. multiplex]MBS9445412.1 hypothetical protein [Xylella fastidiosa subsp. multiplex]
MWRNTFLDGAGVKRKQWFFTWIAVSVPLIGVDVTLHAEYPATLAWGR